MKKLVLLTIAAFVASITLSAQEVTEAQKKQKEEQKKEQKKEQTQVQKEKQDTHGQTVSTVAKETESGPGKGQVVSQTAKTNGEMKKAGKADKENKGKAKGKAKEGEKNKAKGTGARPEGMGPASNGRPVKEGGPGRK